MHSSLGGVAFNQRMRTSGFDETTVHSVFVLCVPWSPKQKIKQSTKNHLAHEVLIFHELVERPVEHRRGRLVSGEDKCLHLVPDLQHRTQ